MANICHLLVALLPWQRPMPKKQNLKNKGNYVGTLLVKFRNKDCKTTELGLLLQVLPVRIVTFVETLGIHLKSSFRSPTIFVSWETLLLCNLCLLQNDFLRSSWNRPVNRLSGRGKSKENKGWEQAERWGGVYAPLAPLADLFLCFSPLQSLFTG